MSILRQTNENQTFQMIQKCNETKHARQTAQSKRIALTRRKTWHVHRQQLFETPSNFTAKKTRDVAVKTANLDRSWQRQGNNARGFPLFLSPTTSCFFFKLFALRKSPYLALYSISKQLTSRSIIKAQLCHNGAAWTRDERTRRRGQRLGSR